MQFFIILLLSFSYYSIECRGTRWQNCQKPCVVYNRQNYLKVPHNNEVSLTSESSQPFFLQIWNCLIQIRVTRPKDDQNTNIKIKYQNSQIDLQSMDRGNVTLTNNNNIMCTNWYNDYGYKKRRTIGENFDFSVNGPNSKRQKMGWSSSNAKWETVGNNYCAIYSKNRELAIVISKARDIGNNLLEYLIQIGNVYLPYQDYVIIDTIHSNGVQNPITFKVSKWGCN